MKASASIRWRTGLGVLITAALLLAAWNPPVRRAAQPGTGLPSQQAMFTTMLLGGVGGMLADFLWLQLIERCVDRQYAEVGVLARWITALEPGIGSVWVFQAWNLAFNISIQFPKPRDRWQWVTAGLDLLTGPGQAACPASPQVLREAASTLLIKVAGQSDPGNREYKLLFAESVETLCVRHGLNPETLEGPGLAAVAAALHMDAGRMLRVQRGLGPLDWRLPQTHALYWALTAAARAGKYDFSSEKFTQSALILSFTQGRMAPGRPDLLGPRPDLLPAINRYFAQIIRRCPDKTERDTFRTGSSHFLMNASYLLYKLHRPDEAAAAYEKWQRLYGGNTDRKTLAEFVAEFETSPKRYVSVD